MNELLIALFFGTASAPCCFEASRFAVQADDAKEARDNIGHLVSPAIVTASVYGTAVYFGASRKQARWIAVGTSVLLIVAKELHDESAAGRFGAEETLIGLGGTAAGLIIAEKLEWTEAKKKQ